MSNKGDSGDRNQKAEDKLQLPMHLGWSTLHQIDDPKGDFGLEMSDNTECVLCGTSILSV